MGQTGNSGTAPMHRQLSVGSDAAMQQVEVLKERCDEMSHSIDAIQTRLATETLGKRQLQELKNSVAQIIGTLDRFQEDHVDAITTGDLETGKQTHRSELLLLLCMSFEHQHFRISQQHPAACESFSPSLYDYRHRC